MWNVITLVLSLGFVPSTLKKAFYGNLGEPIVYYSE